MGGRKWTVEEDKFIENNIDHMRAKDIAKRIGRSTDAVIIRMRSIGVSGVLSSTDLLTQNNIRLLLGVQSRTVTQWYGLGLQTRRVGVYRMTTQSDLQKFLLKNPDLWKASKVEDNTIFLANDRLKSVYLRKKEEEAAKKPYFWTNKELARLKFLYDRGTPYSQISAVIGRSVTACKQKVLQMHKKGWR